MNIPQIITVWLLGSYFHLVPYSSIDPKDVLLPIALITLLRSNAKMEIKTTTTINPATTTDWTTTIPGSCIVCENVNPDVICATFSCEDAAVGCATPGGSTPVTLTCGQVTDSDLCEDFDGCSFDDILQTCNPNDQAITCSTLATTDCAFFFPECCDLVDGMCVEI